jgi:hypothetical protein
MKYDDTSKLYNKIVSYHRLTGNRRRIKPLKHPQMQEGIMWLTPGSFGMGYFGHFKLSFD